MDDNTKALEILNRIIVELNKGNYLFEDLNEIPEDIDPAIKELVGNINEFLKNSNEGYNFTISLAKGNLTDYPPTDNSFIAPLKELHSGLLHLTWQTKAVAKGDYNQKVSFLGDFSVSFNQMIEALKERERLSDELKRNREQLEMAIKGSDASLWDMNAETNIMTVDDKLLHTLGYSKKEFGETIAFDDILNYVHPDDQELIIKKSFDHRNGKIELFDVDFRMKHKNNSWVWMNSKGKIFEETQTGQPKRIVGTHIDITERKNIEKELLELNASKDKFFSIISHDLRGPLATLSSAANLLHERFNDLSNEDKEFFVNAFSSNTSNVYNLMENLLTWSQAQTGKIKLQPELFNFNDLVNNVISILSENAKNKNIEIISNIENGYEIFADKNMLETVMRNLISNAIKFTPFDGIVKIDALIIIDESKEQLLEASISDNGVGMNEETINNLFRIDKSTSKKGTAGETGTGLGLLLCKEFIDEHNGRIWVESTLGKGSCFNFRIPHKSKA